MNTDDERTADNVDIPPSLRRKGKEPTKMMYFRIPLSWWEELNSLAKEYDQGISTFLREATEDWLRRARKVRQMDTSGKKPQLS